MTCEHGKLQFFCFSCDEYVWEWDHLIEERLSRIPALDGTRDERFLGGSFGLTIRDSGEHNQVIMQRAARVQQARTDYARKHRSVRIRSTWTHSRFPVHVNFFASDVFQSTVTRYYGQVATRWV